MRTDINDPLLLQIVQKLTSVLPAERIYLFGSRAYGGYQEESDYDILVVVDDRHGDVGKFIDEGYRALRGIGTSIDLVVMRNSTFVEYKDVVNTIPEAALSEGIELYVA